MDTKQQQQQQEPLHTDVHYPQIGGQHPQQYPQQHPQQHPAAAMGSYPNSAYQQLPQGAVITAQPGVQYVMVSGPPTILFRDVPVNAHCPFCQAQVVTRTEAENGLLVWLLIGAICFFGIPLFLFLGCCLIPLCIPSIKDIGHFCPTCNRKLGTYQRVR